MKAVVLIQNLMIKADGKTVVSLFEKINKTALDVIANVTEIGHFNKFSIKCLNSNILQKRLLLVFIQIV